MAQSRESQRNFGDIRSTRARRQPSSESRAKTNETKTSHATEWQTMEDYFEQGFDIQTSHGMCPGCLNNWAEEIQQEAA